MDRHNKQQFTKLTFAAALPGVPMTTLGADGKWACEMKRAGEMKRASEMQGAGEINGRVR